MKTESAKERRREKHRRERQLNLRALNMAPRFMVRCPSCGATVKMPCLLCELKGAK